MGVRGGGPIGGRKDPVVWATWWLHFIGSNPIAQLFDLIRCLIIFTKANRSKEISIEIGKVVRIEMSLYYNNMLKNSLIK